MVIPLVGFVPNVPMKPQQHSLELESSSSPLISVLDRGEDILLAIFPVSLSLVVYLLQCSLLTLPGWSLLAFHLLFFCLIHCGLCTSFPAHHLSFAPPAFSRGWKVEILSSEVAVRTKPTASFLPMTTFPCKLFPSSLSVFRTLSPLSHKTSALSPFLSLLSYTSFSTSVTMLVSDLIICNRFSRRKPYTLRRFRNRLRVEPLLNTTNIGEQSS